MLAGAAAAVGAAFAVARSDVLAEPEVNAALRCLNIVSAIGVGAVTWSLRPRSRLGPVLIAIGFLYAGTSLQASADPYAYNVGRLLLPACAVGLFYVSLAFPTGRIEREGEQRVMVAIAAAMLVAWGAEALTSPYLLVSSVLSECAGPCPPNPFDVTDAAGTQSVAFVVQAASAWAVVAALVLRLRTASPVQRLALEVPPAIIALLAAAFTAAALLHAAGDDDAVVAVGWVYAPLYVVIPLTFLIGQLRGRLFAVGALRRVLASLGPHPDAARVERDIASALRDPSLRVAFPAPAGAGFLDAAGRPVAVPPLGGGGVAELRDETGRVAVLVHDPALDDVAGLMDAVCAAALLALSNARLSAVLRASVLDLQASRSRIASAGDEARRRLEREVATGPEHRLALVGTELEAAAATTPAGPARARLEELAREAHETLESVRATARGIYPPLLAEEGIGAALEAALAGSPAVTVDTTPGVDRLAEDEEAAVFFACLEAVQNALKHGGEDVRVTISLEAADDGRLRFTVEDDGPGFDPARAAGGTGLANIRDRVEAVGGSVAITSAPGHGTTVEGVVG